MNVLKYREETGVLGAFVQELFKNLNLLLLVSLLNIVPYSPLAKGNSLVQMVENWTKLCLSIGQASPNNFKQILKMD